MSSEKEIIKKYSNGDLTVIWKPKLCIHAGECVKRLPKVYNPEEKPWIKAENASEAALKTQIDACPSGALTYKSQNETQNDQIMKDIKVEVLENGPLLIHGTLEVKKPNGDSEMKSKATAFCRCGASSNKPYCDGEHRKIDFRG
ncbi:MAG: (4Fe-4S)-binding protein [Bacteroidia bacterium]|nr:(4Fe-4S)-binding protein [Bacteroidia bacterium]NND25921.1 hypothetical protein [Flavobacteriaceae bacterium]MBT8278855.1 (4Fe-4S)-binding protein [Bacteroidia bacterium]NNK60760.1 hypothetical protein [Flavobacteriaceae bacterium]NNL33549.1 hypothetical protein [Flavobacteriaceae bacterium]